MAADRIPQDRLTTRCGASRVALSVVALFAGLVLAAAALVVLFAFYPLALLPIAALRTFASAVQRLLTATLGDSYVLVTSPVRTAAILSGLRRDLEWLAPQCDKIAIVAHSQGAALTLPAAAAGNVRRSSWGSERKILRLPNGCASWICSLRLDQACGNWRRCSGSGS